jgi:hypothetical protein
MNRTRTNDFRQEEINHQESIGKFNIIKKIKIAMVLMKRIAKGEMKTITNGVMKTIAKGVMNTIEKRVMKTITKGEM